MKKRVQISLIVLLVFSVVLNGLFFSKENQSVKKVIFLGSNLRTDYNTVHNIKAAHKTATGKGVKVAILDKYFGYKKHRNLYKEAVDFTGNKESLNQIDEHGYWMSLDLKEIAPEAEIYALNVREKDREKEAEAIVQAIDWAIENQIDILTYSAAKFKQSYREKIDSAIDRAHKNGIVTTFIHYSHVNNVLPWGLFQYNDNYNRKPDLRIFHYNYNVLFLDKYIKYKDLVKSRKKIKNGNLIPYFSMSSMSPVLAGFVAILKEVDNTLSPEEYKKILIETSRTYTYRSKEYSHTVDINKAANYLKNNK